jgi:predicted acyl esterase
VEDRQASHARVEHADGPLVHRPIVTPGYAVGVRRAFLVAAVVAAFAAAPAVARADEVSLLMDDGARIDATVLTPAGTPPAGGWPAVMMFHGLGGSHLQLLPLAGSFREQGYAVFVPDARGHGTSGGFVSLDGPREVADVRAEFQWLAARPDVSDTQIGAWGISLGGGAAWNSVVAGVPFKALETVETWSDLYTAFFPRNLAKSGAIFGFAQSVPSERVDPALRPLVPQMIAGENLPTIREVFGARSSLRFMKAVTTPSFLFQGRRDFVFDIDQAAAAYRALGGPKRLYIGDFGHAPSTFPGPDVGTVLGRGIDWFDRFLKGMPNGADKAAKPVEVAPDPWRGRTASYAGLPTVKQVTFSKAGRATIDARGKAVREWAVRGPIEQFGAPVVRVTASTATQWPHLVAVLTAVKADGSETVLSDGGAATTFGRTARTISFKLISDANLISRGAKLRLYLGATSTVQSVGNLLYLKFVPDGSRLTIRKVGLTLPVLPKTISG